MAGQHRRGPALRGVGGATKNPRCRRSIDAEDFIASPRLPQPPAPQDIGDARFERAVLRVHALGPRAIFELLSEIGRARMCRLFIEQRVERFGLLDPRVLRALNGDRMPPVPLHEVRR